MKVQFVNLKGIKEFFWPTVCLVVSFLLALFSSMARGNGQHRAAAFLAVISLIFAFIVCLTLVPRLFDRVRLEFLENLRFFRFTRRGAFFILAVFALSLATFNTGNNLLILILSFLLASFIVSGLVANLVLLGLKISLNVPETIHAGQRAVFLVTLHNLKRFSPSFALKLKGERRGAGEEIQGTDFFVQEKSFPYVRAKEKVSVNLHSEFSRRGVYPVRGFEVKTTFPFGFFSRGRNLDAKGSILVFPALRNLNSIFMRYPHLQGVEQKERRGSGTDLYNIRGYNSGDSSRFVHWKSTAKLARLMIKDFSREEEFALNLFFSTYLPERSPTHLEQFEKAVSYLASLACYYSNRGHSFAFSSGEFEVAVGGEDRNYQALMQYLATVQPSDEIRLNGSKVSRPAVLFSAGDSVKIEDLPRVDYLKL